MSFHIGYFPQSCTNTRVRYDVILLNTTVFPALIDIVTIAVRDSITTLLVKVIYKSGINRLVFVKAINCILMV